MPSPTATAATAGAAAIGGASSTVVAADTVLPPVQVTGTREKVPLSETPASVGVIGEKSIELVKPTHPSQLVSHVPGVAVSVTNGEGHTTAIRQPFTTNPVYLFLEDGVPSRATGFFNHNGLYELDIPQSGGIEITRGPGTALYGSDAIGGIVNVLSRTPPLKPELSVSAEGGSFGWWRLLAGGGAPYATGAARGDLNFTHTDGWRDATAYDRQSGIARWDQDLGPNASVKTVLGFSKVDQQTGANSPLVFSDYADHPTLNYLPIAFRKVDAFRLQSAFEWESGNDLVSLTPYVRDNSMNLLASFTLSSDPTVYDEHNRSVGMLVKWRRDFPSLMKARLITGIDFDYSPGGRQEDAIITHPTGSGASRMFTSYTTGPRVYDYDVSYHGVSPYVHGEISPTAALRVSAGLRFDHLGYSFENQYDATPIAVARAFPGLRYYGQAPDTSKTFDHLSPKFGATYAINADTHLYASYNHGFRVPSEAQLFRPSAATSAAGAVVLTQSALELKPIKANQAELGVRGTAGIVSYDAVVYDLEKRDDIVTLRDNATNFTQTMNAGRTRHRGVEIGAGLPFLSRLRLDTAFSYAKHEYVDWVTVTGNFSGNEMEFAPRVLANTRLTFTPMDATQLQLEWVRVGSYWLDAANTTKYGGYSLINLRGSWALSKLVSLFGSVYNIADRRYADSASITSNTPVFSPGLPRTFFGGVELKW